MSLQPLKQESFFDRGLQKYIDQCRRNMCQNLAVPKDFYMNDRPRFSGPSELALKLFKDKLYGTRNQGTQ